MKPAAFCKDCSRFLPVTDPDMLVKRFAEIHMFEEHHSVAFGLLSYAADRFVFTPLRTINPQEYCLFWRYYMPCYEDFDNEKGDLILNYRWEDDNRWDNIIRAFED